MMKLRSLLTSGTVAVLSLTLFGCTADVDTTQDSTRLEAELPTVETGEEPVDLNPATDSDIDIDTPIEGDS